MENFHRRARGPCEGLPDIAVRNIGSSQDDITLGRAPKECVLGIDHDPPDND